MTTKTETPMKQTVWTVSQDAGKTVAGAYAGKDAKRKAARESGGKTKSMTADEFSAAYPHFEIITIG